MRRTYVDGQRVRARAVDGLLHDGNSHHVATINQPRWMFVLGRLGYYRLLQRWKP